MKRVLVAPLDWGLGHATRCIPILHLFRSQGCYVHLAGSGDSLALLRHEFPDLEFSILPGYQPRYPSKGSMTLKMLRQLPRFFQTIRDEHRIIGSLARKYAIDIIISDNRYGCWSRGKTNVFITHQSNILMPKRFGWLSFFIRTLNEKFMNRFSVVWIPDHPENHSLAGALISFGRPRLRTRVRYIGWLSRLRPSFQPPEIKYDVVAVFSGPEPQRSILEKKVWDQLRSSSYRYFIVRGLPLVSRKEKEKDVADFLASAELTTVLESARVVIARSGYSTLMDLAALGKKAIFIPTPGQTEQEYLAQRLFDLKMAFYMKQDLFSLEKAMVEVEKYSGLSIPFQNQLLKIEVETLLRE